jgi:hypothetical protein
MTARLAQATVPADGQKRSLPTHPTPLFTESPTVGRPPFTSPSNVSEIASDDGEDDADHHDDEKGNDNDEGNRNYDESTAAHEPMLIQCGAHVVCLAWLEDADDDLLLLRLPPSS